MVIGNVKRYFMVIGNIKKIFYGYRKYKKDILQS